jgi:hypothetical protein
MAGMQVNPYDPTDPPNPPNPPAGWRWPRVPKVAVAAGVAAFMAMGGAGLAFAVSGSSSSSPTASPSSTTPSTVMPNGAVPPMGRRGPRGPGRFFGPGGPMGVGGDVIHGQYTIKEGTAYRTIDVQVGSVSSVSSTQITVASADGYSATYMVKSSTVVDAQADGISTVAKGDKVRVTAVVSGSQAVAIDITDTTKIGSSRVGFGFGPPPAPPSGSSGSTGSAA